jgi:predicted transposase/invertase (TIGR01784 family)
MRPTLDPKLDIVFKLLFAAERNRHCLIALLTAVLKPATPILSVTVLNAETRRETVVNKGAILDLHLLLASGEHVHVEMQLAAHAGLRERGLYYWARVYTAQLHRGDSYSRLKPTIGIFILAFSELEGERYHSIFRLLEREDHTPLSDALELHIVELSKLPKGPPRDAEDPVLRWARFFAARSHTEREQLAMTDPDLQETQRALQRLSEDPLAQQLAFDRELELNSQQYYVEAACQKAARKAFQDGVQQGVDQGIQQGIQEGRVHALKQNPRVPLQRLERRTDDRATRPA